MTDSGWNPLDPSRGSELGDARLQLHHAAQLVAACGISYLPRAGDDSHTNMEWRDEALLSNAFGPRSMRVGVRPYPLSLVVFDGDRATATLALDGRTIDDSVAWLRPHLDNAGLDAGQFTLVKHYSIPPHPVADGRAFDASRGADFKELSWWFANAAAALARVAGQTPRVSPIRCWPHHFDIGMLIGLPDGKSIGLGMEPGDSYYPEPYWYVNAYPAPGTSTELPPLDGDGLWHRDQWIGAVLPASRLRHADQRAQTGDFLRSAIHASRQILSEDPGD